MRTKLLLIALVLTGTLQGAAPLARTARGGHSADEVRRVAALIDEQIAAGWQRAAVSPAELADDATFLRRASLDIVGKIPPVHDVRRFLADRSPEKRLRAIEQLLESPSYANHFTAIWLELLLPEAQADFQKRYLLISMHRWLRKNFAENQPYDKMVRELLTLPMTSNNGRGQYFNIYDENGPISPMGYYMAKQGKPEDLAASVGRTFLGVRLECAQCHDHPFGKWTREEFWSQAAFFAGLKGPQNENFFAQPLNEVSDRRELLIPNTERVAQARFLDGKQPKWRFKVGARSTLAEWMTARDNPFFARAIVNRMWEHFFGVGIVDPVDDLVDSNPPSHPELLDLLAQEFVAHDYDLKFLIRAITASRAYQLSSVQSGPEVDPRLFARRAMKGLTANQLFDSLCMATGHRDLTSLMQRYVNFGSTTPRSRFQELFAEQERKIEYHSSIPQALTMMNHQLIADQTHPDRGEVLGAIVASDFMSNSGKIEALFLAALSRKPTAAEADRFLKYVERGGATGNQKQALADVFWALLNSSEFKFNH